VRWFWGDVDHLAVRLRRSTERLNMADGWTGRLGAIGAFTAATLRGETDAVFRWNDPRPFVRESREWVRTRARLVERAVRANMAVRRAAEPVAGR
jgi:hypothetical protein